MWKVSAPWLPSRLLSCLPQLPGNCPELQEKWYGRTLTKSTCIHTFKPFHIQVHKQLHACAHKNKVNAHAQLRAWTSMLAQASNSCRSLCKDNMKRGNLVYLPPLKISQTSSLFFSFSKFSFWSLPLPPSAELGFLLTLALRAAVYEAELMHIQHLL